MDLKHTYYEAAIYGYPETTADAKAPFSLILRLFEKANGEVSELTRSAERATVLISKDPTLKAETIIDIYLTVLALRDSANDAMARSAPAHDRVRALRERAIALRSKDRKDSHEVKQLAAEDNLRSAAELMVFQAHALRCVAASRVYHDLLRRLSGHSDKAIAATARRCLARLGEVSQAPVTIPEILAR
jgi:hypothetical protein